MTSHDGHATFGQSILVWKHRKKKRSNIFYPTITSSNTSNRSERHRSRLIGPTYPGGSIVAPDQRDAIARLSRFIATPTLSKYRLFVWFKNPTLPDHQIVVIARDDDYFFGILHSKAHELWALRLGTSLEDRPRYTPSTTFETFPFPWPPGHEDQSDPKVQAIAEAARELVQLRDDWLAGNGPPELPLEKRTLTNLYNARPDWLDQAHTRLDAAVFHAYGWPHALTDDEILARLLALNLERAAGQGAVRTEAEAGGDEE